MNDAYPQGGPVGLPGLENAAGKVLIHTMGIEKGHKHTANCFGFGQGGSPPPPRKKLSVYKHKNNSINY